MDGSPRHISTFVPTDEQSRFFPKELHDERGKVHLFCQPYVNRARQAAVAFASAGSRLLSGIGPKSLREPTVARILTFSQGLYPLVLSYGRRFLPFLPLSEPMP